MTTFRPDKANKQEILSIVKDANNPLLKPGHVCNAAMKVGLPSVRKQFVKGAK